MDEPYTVRTVERLLGLREGRQEEAPLHVTVVDLLSWARDPGGSNVWFQIAQESEPQTAWTAKRGPLPPDATLACVLWDFMRAVRRLPLREQMIVALTAFGFRAPEIGQVLGLSTARVRQLLYGRDDAKHQEPGSIQKVARWMMNGKG